MLLLPVCPGVQRLRFTPSTYRHTPRWRGLEFGFISETASAAAFPGIVSISSTRPVANSSPAASGDGVSRRTVPVPSSATYRTEPSRAIASFEGSLPTATDPVTAPVAGSTSATRFAYCGDEPGSDT